MKSIINSLKEYKQYTKAYIRHMLVAVVLASILSVINLLKASILGTIIDDIVSSDNLSKLTDMFLMLGLFLVLSIAFSFVLGYINTIVTQRISKKLRIDLVDAFYRVNLESISDMSSKDFMVRLTEDVEIISNSLFNYIATILISVISLIVTFLYIININVTLTLVLFPIIAVQILISTYLSKYSVKNQQEQLLAREVHIGRLNYLFSFIKQLKAYRMKDRVEEEYNQSVEWISKANVKAYLINFVHVNALNVATFIGSIVIFTVGSILISRSNITIGTLFVFDNISNYIYGGITSLAGVFLALRRASVSFQRVSECKKLLSEDESGKILEQAIEEIEFKDVSFSYKTKKVISDLDAVFKKGTFYVVVGKSGIGKSTLVNLLLKFYTADSGDILLNGEYLRAINKEFIRDRVTVVFQDNWIMEGSLKENILLQKKCENSAYLRTLSLTDLVSDFDYDENHDISLFSNGNNISGGQVKRVEIARGILRDSDVLILDESFSQIGSDLTNRLLQNIVHEFQDKILIVITHDLSIAKQADQLLFITENDVLTGSHEELLEKSIEYVKLNSPRSVS